jgi:hypothetical protein
VSEHDCCLRVREVGRISHSDIRDNEHGSLFYGGSFTYESGGQGFGVIIDIEFVESIMRVFGRPKKLSDLNGQACWVTHCHSAIHLLEPLLPGEGKVFDIDRWADEASQREKLIRDAGLWRPMA